MYIPQNLTSMTTGELDEVGTEYLCRVWLEDQSHISCDTNHEPSNHNVEEPYDVVLA